MVFALCRMSRLAAVVSPTEGARVLDVSGMVMYVGDGKPSDN